MGRDESWSNIVVQGWANPQPRQQATRDTVAFLKSHGIAVPDNCSAPVLDDLVRIVSLVWLDGKIVPREQFHIDPSDEGLLFGRGLWESTRTFDGVPWLWPLHLDRLRRTAALLEIDVPPDRLPTSEQVSAFARSLSRSDIVIRLNVTAGQPALGRPGIVWINASLLPGPSESVRLQTRTSPVPRGEPFLVWKTFQYAGRTMAHHHAQKAGFDSALLLDADDNVLEMALANIFLRFPDGWATPTADGGLLPGTVREHLLAHAPRPIAERRIPRSSLSEAQEAFVTNSKVGIVPVARIDDATFAVGAETRELMQWLQTRKF